MCCATGSLNVLIPIPAFLPGEPTSQSRGKFTEMPRFAYMFVNLGIPMTGAFSKKHRRASAGWCIASISSQNKEGDHAKHGGGAQAR